MEKNIIGDLHQGFGKAVHGVDIVRIVMASNYIDAVQFGLTNEMKLEKVWRWARTLRIPDGTTEIQKRTIARRLLQGDTSFQ
ncbi:acyl-CoA dehydrogenase family protein [Brevibacillus brevis]|uniref:acyl-CoA dehydrogenase family protein n=1 Tax=Brevibacillus brevis TaxID=1393 RepID=UPI000E379D17|nr:acyl-CoA dehydrogenase family protein [Brevibacillus brevis]RED35530.1 acyl-CoA dehydrogenase-like protein [Brevibacillus brevis]GEC87802.1 hypothetical protein BBR01nite_01330 [Brevibacillus brevis]VEF89359.1 Acyl-CoA dehydrogenase, C-terminal domain [Brevibacillus brevis]